MAGNTKGGVTATATPTPSPELPEGTETSSMKEARGQEEKEEGEDASSRRGRGVRGRFSAWRRRRRGPAAAVPAGVPVAAAPAPAPTAAAAAALEEAVAVGTTDEGSRVSERGKGVTPASLEPKVVPSVGEAAAAVRDVRKDAASNLPLPPPPLPPAAESTEKGLSPAGTGKGGEEDVGVRAATGVGKPSGGVSVRANGGKGPVGGDLPTRAVTVSPADGDADGADRAVTDATFQSVALSPASSEPVTATSAVESSSSSSNESRSETADCGSEGGGEGAGLAPLLKDERAVVTSLSPAAAAAAATAAAAGVVVEQVIAQKNDNLVAGAATAGAANAGVGAVGTAGTAGAVDAVDAGAAGAIMEGFGADQKSAVAEEAPSRAAGVGVPRPRGGQTKAPPSSVIGSAILDDTNTNVFADDDAQASADKLSDAGDDGALDRGGRSDAQEKQTAVVASIEVPKEVALVPAVPVAFPALADTVAAAAAAAEEGTAKERMSVTAAPAEAAAATRGKVDDSGAIPAPPSPVATPAPAAVRSALDDPLASLANATWGDATDAANLAEKKAALEPPSAPSKAPERPSGKSRNASAAAGVDAAEGSAGVWGVMTPAAEFLKGWMESAVPQKKKELKREEAAICWERQW